MVDYDRELQDDSTESKIIKFDFDFAEKLKIKVGWFFWNWKSQKYRNWNEINLKFII